MTSSPRAGAALALLLVPALLSAPPAQAASSALTVRPGRFAAHDTGKTLGNGRSATTFRVPSTNRDVYVGVAVRSAGLRHGYRGKLKITPNGSMSTSITRARNGVESVLARGSVAGKARPGDRFNVQVDIAGSSVVVVRARVWRVGTAVPGWQLRVRDRAPARISRAGTAMTWSYLSDRAGSAVKIPFSRETVSASTPRRSTGGGTTPGASTGGGRVKPTAGNTGVPAGTKLTQRYGNIVVKRPGTVLNRLDIHGFVDIKAANVTIKNSILRGGTARFNRGMVTNYGHRNLVVVDSDFRPQHTTVWQDGIKGSDYTARRVHIVGNVDSAKVQGDNVTIEDSLLENTHYFNRDPNQGGRPSHNDGIQIQKGRNIVIRDNTIRGDTNFAILGDASTGGTPNLRVLGNWVDGGHCTVKFQETSRRNLVVNASGNAFGPHRKVKSCPLVAQRGVTLTARRNVFEKTGRKVPIWWER